MFYKRDGDRIDSANGVHNSEYSLTEGSHADCVYPVDGWYWFDTMDEALNGLPRDRAGMSCTPRQARLALAYAGLLDTVDAWVAAQGAATKIEWEYASEVRRTVGLVTSAATELGMTEDQIDGLFEYAVTL